MIEDFFKIAANLKDTPRQGWIDKAGISHPESVAEHVFLTSLMAMTFGDYLKINSEKMMKLALLHDLSESITGDLTPEQISKDEKINLENKTMSEILNNLPEEIKNNYLELWHDYIDNKSIEAKILHEIDKLEMALQAVLYSKKFTDKSFIVFLETAKNSIENPELKKIFNSLLNNHSQKEHV